jgi:hypothetical protein
LRRGAETVERKDFDFSSDGFYYDFEHVENNLHIEQKEMDMPLTIEAVFDGKAFLPVTPVAIKPNTRVRISVDAQDEQAPTSFLKTARSLKLDGPPDWAEKLDEYLYGGKRIDNA